MNKISSIKKEEIMDYQIRRAVLGDEETLALIQTESWKAAFADILSPEELKRCTELEKAITMYRKILSAGYGNGYILEVERKPHCIAYWAKTRENNMPGYAELICIHSLSDRWRKGYGSEMMERTLADIKEAGYNKVMLWVFVENERARKFYEAKGFVTYGKLKPNIEPLEICYERIIG